MDNNRFFTVETEARQQFYQIPKSFMCEDSKYFKMNPMTKLLYAILADRNSISMKNGWVDELGRIYFIFNQESLCKVLGVSSPMTLRKYLKELEQNGLLYRKRVGLREPDKMYLLQVEVPESLEKSLMDKNYPSRQINIIHQDRYNLSTSNTNKSNTNIISSSTETEKEHLEEDDKSNADLIKIMKHCQKCNFKLQKRSAAFFLESYTTEQIIKGITIASSVAGDKIKSPKAYLAAVLKDMETPKNVTIQNNGTSPSKNGFKNFQQRNFTHEQMTEREKRILEKQNAEIEAQQIEDVRELLDL